MQIDNTEERRLRSLTRAEQIREDAGGYERANIEVLYRHEFTNLEFQFLAAFIEGLYAEPHFSDQDVSDVAREMQVPVATAKGVLGSLVKKGVVSTDSNAGYDIIYLDEDYFYLHRLWGVETGVVVPVKYMEQR